MRQHPERWSAETRRAHGSPCIKCGRHTYCSSGVCKFCSKTPAGLVPVSVLPEDYLMACASELLRRHNERHELLVKLGIKRVEEAA